MRDCKARHAYSLSNAVSLQGCDIKEQKSHAAGGENVSVGSAAEVATYTNSHTRLCVIYNRGRHEDQAATQGPRIG